jgi:dihydroneopterin aldolase
MDVRIGVLPEEQVSPQTVHLDVELHTDMSRAARSDHLDDALDYLTVVRTIRSAAEGQVFHLVERLCESVLDHVLAIPGVTGARVAARKFHLPGMGAVGHVEIELSSEGS